jgi:hypothetical protein
MNLQAYSPLSSDQLFCMVHLSQIICTADSSQTYYHLDVYWHQYYQKIVLYYNKQFYAFALSGVKNTDVTVRQLLYGLGFNDTTKIDIVMPMEIAKAWTREDILDGDFCTITPHTIRIIQPLHEGHFQVVS